MSGVDGNSGPEADGRFVPPGAPPPGPPGYQPPPGAQPAPGHQPPPGYQPALAQAASPWGAAPPGAWTPPPGMLGAAHKPGAIPLRPLTVGDIYDAAFKIIRFNPRATVGSSVLVTSVAMAIPILVTAVMTATTGTPTFTVDGPMAGEPELAGLAGSFGSLIVGYILQGIGVTLVTGMIAHVVLAAAVGRRLDIKAAWRATEGNRARLIGLSLLIAFFSLLVLLIWAGLLYGIALGGDVAVFLVVLFLTAPFMLILYCWVWIRYTYLAVAPLMLENAGILGALGRSRTLTLGHYWRTLGIAALTALIAQFAAGLLATPISLIGQVLIATTADSGLVVLVMVVVQALTTVIASAFVTPFTTAVASLQYVDLRMRKEAFDVELMTRSGIISA